MSANVYCFPHRYGPSLKCCKSALITFSKLSNCVDNAFRFVGDGFVSTLWNRAGRFECLWIN